MKSFKTIIVCFLIVTAICVNVSAQEKPYSIGITLGTFIPQDWKIQGLMSVDYDSSGQAINTTVMGFGNGVDLMIYGTYYFTDWGIRLETGPRLLQEHLLDVIINQDSVYYDENRLNIIPVTLTMFHKIQLPDTKIIPYIGIGSGVYFSSWEQKYYIYYPDPQPFTRNWDKGSRKLMGVHFLTGLDFLIYSKLYFSGDLKYCYVSGDLKIRDVDSGSVMEVKNLNIGGTSLRVGLNFKF